MEYTLQNCCRDTSYSIMHYDLGILSFPMSLMACHEAVNDFKNSSEDKALATEIGGELLVLTRAVKKKHTSDSERALKFHLAQPARMLARIMKRKTRASRPWTVNFSWNSPVEVFDCFKVVGLVPVAGGLVLRNTCSHWQINIAKKQFMRAMSSSKMKKMVLLAR